MAKRFIGTVTIEVNWIPEERRPNHGKYCGRVISNNGKWVYKFELEGSAKLRQNPTDAASYDKMAVVAAIRATRPLNENEPLKMENFYRADVIRQALESGKSRLGYYVRRKEEARLDDPRYRSQIRHITL